MTGNLPPVNFHSADIIDLDSSETREWLVTNGLGSFASGTIAGSLTRRYHGLLIAALQPPGGRTLLVSKIEEIALYDGREYELFTNNWVGAQGIPDGYRHIRRFHLDGTMPVWTYAFADGVLEKRVWMLQGQDKTCVRYRMINGGSPLQLTAKLLVNNRDMHADSHGQDFNLVIEPLTNGLKLTPTGRPPFFLLAENAGIRVSNERYENFLLKREIDRGFTGIDDHLFAGTFTWTLQPGESASFLATLEPEPHVEAEKFLQERKAYESDLVNAAGSPMAESPVRSQLTLAADQFIVRRKIGEDPDGRTVIAGYHWFSDWGRDTMIALPGLTLATGRPEIAKQILQTFAEHVSKGMLPNRFPEAGESPDYNTVDAALWYFEAVRAYYSETGDLGLVKKLFPVLEDMVAYHRTGTRYNIHVDPEDGLLYAGIPGKQLTWMDVKIGDWVVTPRIGKPVEINALWFNALNSMAGFASALSLPGSDYLALADRVRKSFRRFWNESRGYCYDVLDGPDGDDPALRPNQLLAVSLFYSPLDIDHQKAIVDVCLQKLLTPVGMRSLGPDEAPYAGRYTGDVYARDSVYHQGTTWGWLIGPFVEAHLRVYGDVDTANGFLIPLQEQIREHGLGSLSEIYDGDSPHTPGGAIAQAWSVAELLRVWQLLDGTSKDGRRIKPEQDHK